MTALKTLLWSIFVPGTVTVLVPRLLLASRSELFFIELSSFRFFGIVPIILGALIYFWCAWDFTFMGKGTPAPFDPPKELVVKGPYRFVRNPIYVGVTLALFGESILFESTVLFVYAILLLLVFHLWVVYYEEPALKRKFGESYERYCNTVPRWLPSAQHHQ